MEGLHIFLVALLGVVSCSGDSIPGSVLKVTVRPGDNITLYCDCKLSSGVYIVWNRNCSHENQPSLVLKVLPKSIKVTTANYGRLNILPHYTFVRNYSSNSYDLMIINITDSDEGLYYCGTEERRVEDRECIYSRNIYSYGNVTTRILFNSSSCHDSSGHISNSVFVVSWMMAFTPAIAVVSSSFIFFILLFYFCQKIDKEPKILQNRPDTRGQTRWDQDDDVFFTRVVFRAKDGHQ